MGQRTRTRAAGAVGALAVLALGVPALATVPAQAAPSCAVAWGSTPQAAPQTRSAPLVGVRAGRHACFDRLVLDAAGRVDGFSVRYVGQVRAPGSGNVVPVAGGARLEVRIGAPAYDAQGRATYTPARRDRVVDVSGATTFRQVVWAGSFEGETTLALGVRARLPVRAFVVPGPGARSRLVVDVAHRW